MNWRFRAIDASLNQAGFRWQLLRFLRQSAMLGIVVCLLVSSLGAAILMGWIRDLVVGIALTGLIAAAGLLAWGVSLLRMASVSPDRKRLGAALERRDRRWLDRLNTLLFLETRRENSHAESFAHQIARQAQSLVNEKHPAAPFSAKPSLIWLAAFASVLAVTALLNYHFRPWNYLKFANETKGPKISGPQGPIELARSAGVTNRAWGEIRITDPGADLTVTKVDVVQLQIEAAASHPLTNVSWFSAVNGAAETPHPLPSSSEPCYGNYSPSIYLDELQLSDWDVVSYYARAKTDRLDSYGSQVFFLEVRPFREDILKLPGGQGGQAYQTLSEISSLIGRQQQIIRQTYQHAQQPPEAAQQRAQDRNKLAGAEGDLSDSAQHLYAKLAGEMENKPIGDALDNLARAEQTLDHAATSLRANTLTEGQNLERRALSELVAARKMLQKAVGDRPEAFQTPSSNEPPPATADSSQKLNSMAEFRNESKAAAEFARKALEQQKNIEQQTRIKPRSEQPELGDQEEELGKALKDFQAQHPHMFDGAQKESQQAQKALANAASELRDQGGAGRSAAQDATKALENFNKSFGKRAAEKQLADAYKLKQMLDSARQLFDQRANSKTNVSDADLQNAARETRQTLQQLKEAAEEDPTRDAFGQPLRDALSGQNKVDLDARLFALEQAEDEAARQQQSAAARDGLGKVMQAFKSSQPESLQMAQNADALKPREQDRLNQGAAELDSLIKELEKAGQLPAEDQAKQGSQAFQDLQAGMRSRFGDNAQGDQLLQQLQQMLRPTNPDVAGLKGLLEQIQRFSLESTEQLARKEDESQLTHIDPNRLPPAYRGAIQRYFERLSQQ